MKSLVRFLMAGTMFSMIAPSVMASRIEHLPVTKTVILNAPTSAVWKALRCVRATDSLEHHVVSSSGSTSRIQENFEVPVLGPVSCLYQEHEIESRRVEYHLISSANFVAFEGAWDMTPCSGGKQTSITLSSFADTGSHMPFASKVTRAQTAQRVDMRMNELKSIVEHQSLASVPK